VINSHKKSTIALDHLLKSMKEMKEFFNYEILIVIGGHFELSDYLFTKKDNVTYIYCNHNSIDFTGLITLEELYHENIEDYYLYLHDTCRIGDNFFNKLKSINLTKISTIKLNKSFSMNMGIYSQKTINKFCDFLLSKKNVDENRCLEFKAVSNEDYIFDNDINNVVLENYDGWNFTGPTDYYETGTQRIVEYYPNLDLYKMKANWGQCLTLDN